MDLTIRPEGSVDRAAVFAVHAAAFETEAEADLVDALRGDAEPIVSLVAATDGTIVGHILFSPATLDSDPALRVMGLGPMAVLPDWQSRGIGSALVREGLAACRRLGVRAVVVLGHPGYYPRFGFRPGSTFGIRSEYDVPDEVFMALELEPGALQAGTIRYHEAFSQSV
jgi:putative acetyltransferase